MRQVEGVESARAVAEAQQETVALAQLLQSQARSHDHSVRELTNRTNDKLKQAQDKLDKVHLLLAYMYIILVLCCTFVFYCTCTLGNNYMFIMYTNACSL